MNVLIFTGGLHPQKSHFDLFMQMHYSIDFVIAADSGFDTAQSYGVKCDMIIGDMDSITNKKALQEYPKEKIITFPEDKDYTDTELALFEAKKLGAKHVTLVGGDGGRLDHTLALLKVFEGSVYPNVWLCKEQVIYLMDEKNQTKKSFLLSNKDVLSVFAVQKESKIQSTGLEWELNDVKWENGSYSVSNKSKDSRNPITLIIEKGRFLILVSYNAIILK